MEKTLESFIQNKYIELVQMSMSFKDIYDSKNEKGDIFFIKEYMM